MGFKPPFKLTSFTNPKIKQIKTAAKASVQPIQEKVVLKLINTKPSRLHGKKKVSRFRGKKNRYPQNKKKAPLKTLRLNKNAMRRKKFIVVQKRLQRLTLKRLKKMAKKMSLTPTARRAKKHDRLYKLHFFFKTNKISKTPSLLFFKYGKTSMLSPLPKKKHSIKKKKRIHKKPSFEKKQLIKKNARIQQKIMSYKHYVNKFVTNYIFDIKQKKKWKLLKKNKNWKGLLKKKIFAKVFIKLPKKYWFVSNKMRGSLRVKKYIQKYAKTPRKLHFFNYSKVIESKQALQFHRLVKYSKQRYPDLFTLWNYGITLGRGQGVKIWTLLHVLKLGSLRYRYQNNKHPVPKSVRIMTKQFAWQKRRQGFLKRWTKRLVHSQYRFLKKRRWGMRFFKAGLKSTRLNLVKRRQQFAAWHRVIRKRPRWNSRVNNLYDRLQWRVPHLLTFRTKKIFGRKIKKQVYTTFRNQYAWNKTYRKFSSIRDYLVRNKKHVEWLKLKQKILTDKKNDMMSSNWLWRGKYAGRGLVSTINILPHFSTYEEWNSKIFNRKAKQLKASIKFVSAPWRNKKPPAKVDPVTLKALAIFNKAFPEFSKPILQWKNKHSVSYRRRFKNSQPHYSVNRAIKSRLLWVFWYNKYLTRYHVFKPVFKWSGLSSDYFLGRGFKRLRPRRKKGRFIPSQKTSFIFNNRYSLKYTKLQLSRSVQKTLLQTMMNVPSWNKKLEAAPSKNSLEHKPMFFSLHKATRAFDFNKFFKVNKVAAHSIVEMSTDLYMHYLENLNHIETVDSLISTNTSAHNTYAARSLRKYMLLLKLYFNEVYGNKMSKKIPASSAMHWIREYLRLTNSIKRRPALWNRFNRVAFHFLPKAKDDEQRGRKKKILFKLKILFDRLFKWLYAEKNARYALSTPIQKGTFREYILRNQFIFKKQFKIKLLSKTI